MFYYYDCSNYVLWPFLASCLLGSLAINRHMSTR